MKHLESALTGHSFLLLFVFLLATGDPAGAEVCGLGGLRYDEITRVIVKTTQHGPTVDVRLDARGAASMLSTTRENVGSQLAAVYNGQVINHAMIRGVFGRQFQVTGLTSAEAHSLAMQFDRAIK